jgi:hypothetical protein
MAGEPQAITRAKVGGRLEAVGALPVEVQVGDVEHAETFESHP